ncbi:RDD family protein [Glycomyces sp. L485]|uniref:RDD family protein n=1 Tax=Glycomyces sp. L485 TaxID=2909235 RepID=UPI001F4BB2D1|nr:RDD family protein [Glycomyces sp. L485]MCH7229487.1 RDD family protein [Glycomyces sp. L485]
MTTIEPGWYRDPAEPATQRYWDGSAWVGKPVPADAEPPERPEPEAPPTPEPSQSPLDEVGQRPAYGRGSDRQGPPKIIQRAPGVTQPPDSVPIRSLGVTVGWITNDDVRRVLAGRVLAHPGQRFIARLVDFIVLVALNAVVNGYFVYQFFDSIRPAVEQSLRGGGDEIDIPSAATNQWWIVILIAMGLWFAYEVPSTLNTGQTLGKRLMGIKVVSLAPGEPGWGRLILRWSYAALPMICFPLGAILWILDGLYCIRDRPFRQCLHDKSPGTAVVEVPREKEPAA